MHANTIRAIITKIAPEEFAWKMRSIWIVNINMNLHARPIQQWMVIEMNMIERIKVRIFNSSFWYHVYYKHTRRHKEELAATRARAIKRRDEILVKMGLK